jgi:hypothetical protein
MRNGGGWYFDRVAGRYDDFPELGLQAFGDEPRHAGLSLEVAATQHASWAGSLLLCAPPKAGFTRGEQRVLWLALDGRTDQELHDELGVSLTAIKKRWRGIYDRAAESLPPLFGDLPSHGRPVTERGKERRRRLLAYLRDHPEELRPVSRTLLRQPAVRVTNHGAVHV